MRITYQLHRYTLLDEVIVWRFIVVFSGYVGTRSFQVSILTQVLKEDVG